MRDRRLSFKILLARIIHEALWDDPKDVSLVIARKRRLLLRNRAVAIGLHTQNSQVRKHRDDTVLIEWVTSSRIRHHPSGLPAWHPGPLGSVTGLWRSAALSEF